MINFDTAGHSGRAHPECPLYFQPIYAHWLSVCFANHDFQGDLILQPGKYDIDRLNLDYNKSKYGTLYRWVTVKTMSSTECPISNIEKSLHNYLASLLNRKTWMMPLVMNTVDVAIGLPEYNDRDITVPIIKIPKLTGVFNFRSNVVRIVSHSLSVIINSTYKLIFCVSISDFCKEIFKFSLLKIYY